MTMTIKRLVPRDRAIAVGAAFETTAREALQGLEDEDLTASFGIWEGDDGVQFVCKVETPAGDPLSSEPPWRWWSRLFRTPGELRTELGAMAARRLQDREGPTVSLVASEAAFVAAS